MCRRVYYFELFFARVTLIRGGVGSHIWLVGCSRLTRKYCADAKESHRVITVSGGRYDGWCGCCKPRTFILKPNVLVELNNRKK